MKTETEALFHGRRYGKAAASKKAILERIASDLEALDPLWLDDDIAQLILDVRKVASRAGAD